MRTQSNINSHWFCNLMNLSNTFTPFFSGLISIINNNKKRKSDSLTSPQQLVMNLSAIILFISWFQVLTFPVLF